MSKEPKASKLNSGHELQAPKGMHDLIGDQVFLYQGFAEKAAEIALYYGFKPIETPILEFESLFNRSVGADSDIVSKEMYTLKTKGGDRLALRPEGTAPVMRAYIEHGMQSEPQPLMFYYYGQFFRHENPQKGRLRELRQFGLEIIGSKKSITDATVIRVVTLALEEAGLNNLTVKINSIGDNECRGAYRRELLSYYKKHTKEICADCRERLKTNPLRVLDCKNPKCIEIKKGAPESISFLCHDCKAHFKEVLEYLDQMNIRYEIDSGLVRGLDYYSRTVFEVVQQVEPAEGVEASEPLALAGGGRYDYLGKALQNKKDFPAFGAGIGVDRVVSLDSYAKLSPKLNKPPKVFFIQLSFDAKLKSFEVIEVLRKAKVPVMHSLSKDSLGAQLGMAEKMNVPYTIILGQKEAMENSVIVRNMDNRSQDTVPIPKLAEYLKKK